MKRIADITNTKSIHLDNVKVKFQIKLLQYNINNILYKYNNKFAFPQYVEKLKSELTNTIKSANINDDKDSTELLTKTRELYVKLCNHQPEHIEETAIDNSLKFILFNFIKNKATLDIQQEIELLEELKMYKDIIANNNIPATDRINNCYKLIEQLKNSIIAKL